MREITVGYVVGSLSRESINRKYLNTLIQRADTDTKFTEILIADLPVFNRDMESHLPQSVVDMKAQIAEVDALLFVTPEHNRSIPAALKNAIDFGSRPPGSNVWNGKPAGIIGVTRGAIGTAVAQSHLRSILPVLGVRLLGHPEMYVRIGEEAYDSEGHLNESHAKRADRFLENFSAFVRREIR
ncbi:NADPH-dependent FMN reductase [Lysinibacter sp. HNR]|uniref:NADPH-dependent FMN reductase n=1 Tax=Lysinibacter sp. HNR TaxID=3031408 RepID=UPI0024361392|nr:NADPH-dependent FMN reductase [Lysinibacter sp. HNR]WGD38343.1 NAD(P)H-dependent oxidoreductase [Lysinibacter sp. HNR]